MLLYILRRLVSIAVTFFVVSVIVFLMMHAVPGGPFDGNDMPVSKAVRDTLMAKLGLDQPLWVQYVNYMAGVLQGNWGVPYQSPGVAASASEEAARRGTAASISAALRKVR